ncbi:MAG: hypothetical protein NXI31_13330 [bacterium]|nr:hypothetical protein [bacterium]
MSKIDDEFDDEVFDAMLRVAITEGRGTSAVGVAARPRAALCASPRDASERDGEPPREPPRSRLTPWLVAAGLFVCVGVWWSNASAGDEPAQEAQPLAPSPDPVQDPKPSPSSSDPMTPTQFAGLAARLGVPAQRPAAIRALVAGGSVARDHLVRRLASEPAELASGEPNPVLEGMLFAATAFGRQSGVFVEVVTGRLPDVHADQMLVVLELFAEAALWVKVPAPDGEVGEDFMNVYGRDFGGLGLTATNRCMAAFGRVDARGTARERAEAGQLLAALRQAKGRRGDAASVRLAALHRLAEESDLRTPALAEIEFMLAQSHPPFLILGWKVGGATMTERDSNPAIHRAAAELLIRHAAARPVSVLAHAHCVRTFDDPMARRRSALALGRFLADRADNGEGRLVESVAALRTPLAAARSEGVLADVATIALAGDAATALGMIGPAAHSALTDLELLADHGNAGLAKRVKAAIRRIGSSGR